MSTFIAAVISAALGGFVAAVVWPWLGPVVFVNPPQFTTAGCWAYALYVTIKLLAKQVRS